MSFAIETRHTESPAGSSRREPALILAAICMAGIAIDRWFPLSLDGWLGLALLAVLIWLIAGSFAIASRPKTADAGQVAHAANWIYTLAILLGWFCLAGAWHHWRYNCIDPVDIANSAADESQLVRVEGKIVQTPWMTRRPDANLVPWRAAEQSTFLLECHRLMLDSTEGLPVAGIARVTVEGTVLEIDVGDRVLVTGEFSRPFEPANPGDFDQREFLRTQGIHTVIRSKSADGIERIRSDRGLRDWLMAIRGFLRRRAENLITDWLSPETAPIAKAMLLGSRVQIDLETQRDFRESGLLHVLAISGMNVGLLWMWLWAINRWLGRSMGFSVALILVVLPLYALVTDANPPIVRATTAAVVVAFGQLVGRTGSVANSLALAGLAVLVWNPNDLFNTGAQLSFLAVFAILHAKNWLTRLRQQWSEGGEEEADEELMLVRGFRFLMWRAVEANVIGMSVWMITSPLIAREFHLVSPIGSLLTVALAVPVTIMFWVGYTFLLLGMISSHLFGWIGILFDFGLRCFVGAVHAGAQLDWGHLYVPAPPLWWTAIFYGLTVLPLLLIASQRWGAAVSVRAGLVWTVFGLGWGLSQPMHSGLTCTFISVGHGLGILIECPDGRNLLYDAGGMTNGGSIARTIAQTLWLKGQTRLDAVLISHADADHCNALNELCHLAAPRQVMFHRSFLDFEQPVIADLIEQTGRSGAKIKLVSEGQSLKIDSQVNVRILHPSAEFRSARDNPNSLVVSLEYAGRRILLTGDLEQEGLEQLLTTNRLDADVLLSPHHGSLKANPKDLARWATPEYVVVSTGDAAASNRLIAQYGPETEILTTATYGAIRCRISPAGELSVEPFKSAQNQLAAR